MNQEGQEEARQLIKQLITDLGQLGKKHESGDAPVLILSLCGNLLKGVQL
jgi:hypothetical protein